MTNAFAHHFDPALDLSFDRIVDVSPELIWKAWTTPDLIKRWFTPAPWTTIACEIDLRPGGKFQTMMRSPEGMEFPNLGCYLEVIENRRLVWTSALGPGYRPVAAAPGLLAITAMIALEPHGNGTKYSAFAIHSNPEDKARHEAMGFREGWGKALDQLVEVVRTI